MAMEHVGDAPPREERAASAARALAGIHHAALGRGEKLAWLPRADPSYFAEKIVQGCWRTIWRYLLHGEGYTDWYGRVRESKEGGDLVGAVC
ncbi:MAG: hypothetical protein U0841_03450 [Chloroflexia bacterium]